MLGLPLPRHRRRRGLERSDSDNLQFIGDMRGYDWLCRGNPETRRRFGLICKTACSSVRSR
ncbi:hypothetical protein ACNKHL_15610 [Shigella flexneri]